MKYLTKNGVIGMINIELYDLNGNLVEFTSNKDVLKIMNDLQITALEIMKKLEEPTNNNNGIIDKAVGAILAWNENCIRLKKYNEEQEIKKLASIKEALDAIISQNISDAVTVS